MTLSTLTTYQAGLLQAKAYRMLKEFMTFQLKRHSLSMMEWALLGYMYDRKAVPLRINDLASYFDVDISLISNMLNRLEHTKMVTRKIDEEDRRMRWVQLTLPAQEQVKNIEKHLRTQLAVWLRDIDHAELTGYVSVLKKIASKTSL